jgi:hypothetical protein
MEPKRRMIDDADPALANSSDFGANNVARLDAMGIVHSHQYAAFGQIEGLAAQRP